MIKKTVLISVIAVAFVAVLLFAFQQLNEKQKYETYLSQELINEVSRLSWATVTNGYLLRDAIRDQQLSREDIEFIQSKYSSIAQSGRFITDLSRTLGVIDTSDYRIHPYPYFMATEFDRYLKKLKNSFENGESLELNEEQLDYFERMKEVNDVWTEALITHLHGVQIPPKHTRYGDITNDNFKVTTRVYWNTYRGNFIKNQDWIDMLEQKQRESKPFISDLLTIP
ncbi:hypothetical protein [Evansella halocellulosilytica]|uniref:hypothetical protein n=1 Tax=Evansella halocellulosilytica TaxID=2011013 RepID=UPI000BB84199|nr:hypothetical protein [Evansella halocellulosilytica]